MDISQSISQDYPSAGPHSPRPQVSLNHAIHSSSPTLISQILSENPSLLPSALRTAVYNGNVTIASHLITNHNASVAEISPAFVAAEPSIALLEVLVAAGWDINSKARTTGRLVESVSRNEEMVRWCVEKGGANVDFLREEEGEKMVNNVARGGTVGCWRFLREKGAKIGHAALHHATKGAAESSKSDREERMKMVKFLVEEEGLGVTAMDSNQPRPGCHGPVIMWAANENSEGSEEVVRWLLQRGADPRQKGWWDGDDTLALAERRGNEKVAKVIREWKAKG